MNLPVLRQLLTGFGSEDNLAMLNYYMLMNLETDDRILAICREGLQKRWRVINDSENSLFNFIYHALTERTTPELNQGIDALTRFPINKTVPVVALKRNLPRSLSEVITNIRNSKPIPIEERPVDEYLWRVNPLRRDFWSGDREGTMEFTGIDFLIAVYLGLYHKFIK